jgi:tetratricopeptide (TPR) repeat protein
VAGRRHAGAVAATLTAYLEGVAERLRRAELARVEAQARAEEERKRRRLTVILAASVLALALVGGGGGTWLARERADRARREAAERDAALLASLTEVRSLGEDDRGGSAREAGYADAFRRHGLDVESPDPALVAARLRARPAAVAAEVAGALDDWASLRRTRGSDPARWAGLVRLARLADPDPWRNEVREALELTDRDRRAARVRQLLVGLRVEEQPAATLVLLAQALAAVGDYPAAVRLLRAVVRCYPGDVWVNFELATDLRQLQPPQPDEVIRYLTAAGALRRVAAHELGHALQDRGRVDEALEVFRDLTRMDGSRRGLARHYLCLGETLYRRSGGARAKEAFKAAAAAFREVVRAEPDDARGHLHLGQAVQALGSLDEAIAEYREAVRLQPDDSDAHKTLGGALAYKGDVDGAIASFRAYARLQPNDHVAHYNLGLELSRKKAWDESVAEYREALRLRPDYPEALNNLGSILSDRGSLDEAIATYREALRHLPGYALGHANLGGALRRKGLSGEAISACRAAIWLRPDLAEAHCNLGDALMDGGSLDEAVAAYREALRHSSDYPEARRGLEQVLQRLAALEQTVAEHRVVVRLRPDDPEAHFKLANVLASKESAREAIAEYDQALRLRPDHLEARGNLARALERDGQIDRAGEGFQVYGWALRGAGNLPGAVAALREAVRLLPNSVGARCNLSHTLLETGDTAGALREAREAVRLQPTFPDAHGLLGLSLRATGDRQGALSAVREEVRLNPASPDAHGHFAIVLIGAGDLAGAIKECREGIRLKPDLPGPRLVLAEALLTVDDAPGAITELREVIRLHPDMKKAHLQLGVALRMVGQYAESEAELRQGDASADELREAQERSALERRLPAVIAGKDRPVDDAERLTMAAMSAKKQLPAIAVRLYEDAFAAQPDLADDLRAGHRFAAARCAALAGTGQGRDDPPPDTAARARLRAQALAWLRADLAASASYLNVWGDQVAHGDARTRLDRWRADPGLAVVRAPEALDRLPEAERGAWRAFWVGVDSVSSLARNPRIRQPE